jgi:diguanylate cyclase (GGDEF)-like protein/PAS domain S-box-containing protein
MNSLVNRCTRCLLLLAWFAGAAIPSGVAWSAEPVRIGVLAFRPKPQTLEQWQPLAIALKRAIPEQDFVVEALTFPELELAVASRQLDFVLTNPGYYVLLTKRNGLSAPLATLAMDEDGRQSSAFGGVVFTLTSQSGIKTLADIEGRSVATTSVDSFGGYQMQVYEMSRAGLRLPQSDTLVTTGMPHDKVVDAVLAGRADVGFVRTGVLEGMVREGRLDAGRVRVLNRQNMTGYPLQLSTRLYPEWPFAALPHTDPDLARQVAATLFLLEESTGETHAMGIHGFNVPADYTPVADLLKELRAPPFEAAPMFTLQDVAARYRWQVVAALLALGLILMLGFRVLWTNRWLKTERGVVLLQKAQLQDSEERYRIMVEWSPEAILVHRLGAVLYVNTAAIKLFGATDAQDLIGRSTASLIHPDFLDAQVARMHSINDKAAIVPMVESRFIKLDGTPIDVQVQGTSIVYDGAPAIHVSIRDITEVKAHRLQLEHLAHFDPLTGLPNRVLMADRMRQGMSQAQRRGQSVAVAYLDLDGFKAINDHHGHEAGDQLLIALANRMKQSLREGDTLARIGGDEFVAVLVDLGDVAASLPMLTRLLTAAAQPVQMGELSMQVSASLGVTFYPQADDIDADQLLRQADQSMYQAKLAGKNRYHVFDAEHDRSLRGHHESQDRICTALVEREFVLYYQPKVNMRTGKVVGAEALIRWVHPEKGLLPPAAFLPVIEDHPLAVDIGEWVIDTALTQVEIWRAAGLDIPVSVNVGALQLQRPRFVERLRSILEQHPTIQPGYLDLEVLETSALEDVEGVSLIMRACRDMGVTFALDDFGTGYSSLTYLKRLPAKLLKIDQSFVRDMLDDPDDLAILKGVIGLASAFHREVIAEGVETIAHGVLLLQLGCDLAQGYGIARPMPAHQMPAWCATWRPDAAWGSE